jgi:hypothetical protein
MGHGLVTARRRRHLVGGQAVTRRPPRLPERPSFADVQSCNGKIPFFARKVAKQRAREINAAEGTNMRAYRCSACGYYHLGHAPGASAGIRHTDRLFQTPQRKATR